MLLQHQTVACDQFTCCCYTDVLFFSAVPVFFFFTPLRDSFEAHCRLCCSQKTLNVVFLHCFQLRISQKVSLLRVWATGLFHYRDGTSCSAGATDNKEMSLGCSSSPSLSPSLSSSLSPPSLRRNRQAERFEEVRV